MTMLGRFLSFKTFTARFYRSFSTISNENEVVFEKDGLIATIGINKPSKRNCLSSNTLKQLKDAFRHFDESDCRVCILYGEGGNFSGGFDIDEVVKCGYDKFTNIVHDWTIKPMTKKPLICALNGYAVAEGLELALACDLRVIEDTASLGFHGRRFGVPTSFLGAERLSNLVGQSRALDLILTGRTINGKEAKDWGLAARAVSTGTAFGQSMSLAHTLAKYPLEALQYDRLRILKYNWIGDYQLLDELTNEINGLNTMSKTKVLDHLPKFLDGIGRHGTTRNIIIKDLPEWEKEDSEISEEDIKKML